MTLQSSGTIKMTEVNLELKIIDAARTATSTISLDQAPVRVLGGKPTGKISMSDLYGKSSYVPTLRVQEWYNVNTTWTAPAGVNKLKRIVGWGGNAQYVPPTEGTAIYSITSMYIIINNSDGPNGITPGNFTWDAAFAHSQQVLSQLETMTSWEYWTVVQYNNGYTFSSETRQVQIPAVNRDLSTARIPGTAESNNYPFWQLSGPIVPYQGPGTTTNLHDVLSVRHYTGVYDTGGGTYPGADLYAFGLMWRGARTEGGDSDYATEVEFRDFPITPGQTYNINFYSAFGGGFLRIEYLL